MNPNQDCEIGSESDQLFFLQLLQNYAELNREHEGKQNKELKENNKKRKQEDKTINNENVVDNKENEEEISTIIPIKKKSKKEMFTFDTNS